MKTKLSSATIKLFILSFVAGFAYGIYRYTHHSSVYQPNDPKNDAILVHIIIAVCVAIAITAIQIYRNHKRLANIWKAPFSLQAFQRFRATMFPAHVTPLSIIRALICLLPLYIIVFEPFRMGAQIIDGLDPAATNNAWGGPTYIGAMAAHYMDCLILLYAGAFILHWIMVRHAANKTNLKQP